MVDTAKLIIRAGKGGNGAVSFRREKFIPKGGPDGGDGGKGGSIYLETDNNQNTLDDFAHRQKFEAQSGDKGSGKKSSGLKGEDLVIKVPLGTIVKLYPRTSGKIEVEHIAVKAMDSGKVGRLILKEIPEVVSEEKVLDFNEVGMKVLIAKGGTGGKGNFRFMSARETTPMTAEQGQVGQCFEMEMSLKLLADVGLVGLPNAGKSTLLSVLSNARPKVADYEFTTLEPNLGVLKTGDKKLVIADIPGLIEGASEGKGLGIKFLKHIERTKVLIHLVPATAGRPDGEDPEDIFLKYKRIRKELENYGGEIEKKEEIVVLSKTDLISKDKVLEIQKYFKKKKIDILPISAAIQKGIDKLIARITYIH